MDPNASDHHHHHQHHHDNSRRPPSGSPSHITLPGSPLMLGLSGLTSDYSPRQRARRPSISSPHHHHHQAAPRGPSISPSLRGRSPRLRSAPAAPSPLLAGGSGAAQHLGSPRLLGSPLLAVPESGAASQQEDARLVAQEVSLGRPAIADENGDDDDNLNGDEEENEEEGEAALDFRAELAAASSSSPSHFGRRPGSIREMFPVAASVAETHPHPHPHHRHPHSPRRQTSLQLSSSMLTAVDAAGGWLMTDFGQGRKSADGSVAWSEDWRRLGFLALGAWVCVLVGIGVICGVEDWRRSRR